MLKEIYKKICKFEELTALFLLFSIAMLVFSSAMLRYIGRPLNWAQDLALVFFAWMVFMGGDITIRNTRLIGIDVLVKRFPNKVQKWISIVFQIIILMFLLVLIIFGYQMVVTGAQRSITTIGISYAWVTASVPVGGFLMFISTCIRMNQAIKTPASEWGGL